MTKEEAKEILKKNGCELENMSNDFKNDKEVVLASVTNNHSLEYASEDLRNEKEII